MRDHRFAELEERKAAAKAAAELVAESLWLARSAAIRLAQQVELFQGVDAPEGDALAALVQSVEAAKELAAAAESLAAALAAAVRLGGR